VAQNPAFRRALRRYLLLIAGLVFGAAAVAGYLNPGSRAQTVSDNSEAAFAQKADKTLKLIRAAVAMDRAAVAKGRFAQPQSMVDQTARFAAITRSGSLTNVAVIVSLAGANTDQLKNAGFAIQAQVGEIATLELDVDQLPKLASLASVRKIFAATLRHPLNDRARQSIGIDNSAGQRVVSQVGRGVVVGIIDTGIDFRHLDFTKPGSSGHETRIKALLDMTVYDSQSTNRTWNYALAGQLETIGHLYTPADLNSALQLAKPADQNADPVKQRDKNGHGTHVAATAAGNGLSSPTPGVYAGMAPEADLIIVKASRQNDGKDTFRTTDIINALEFIKQKAAELGEPFVINLSLGSQGGPHDGTNQDERAIDTLVNGASGRAVCVAAGNEGDTSIHALATVPTGASQSLGFNVSGAAEFIDLYQKNSDRFLVTITRPDGTTLGPVAYDPNGFASPNGQASDQYVQIYNSNDDKGDSDAANDQPDIFIIFKPGAPSGAWQLTLQDADTSANQPFDAWAGDGVTFSNFVDKSSHLIASPGTARGAITVGAFITRSASFPVGGYAPFTSPGPTADGRQKPDISAPGYYLYSARSTDVADSNYGTIGAGPDAPADSVHYTGLAGTSMSTPVSAGAVALLLESSPSLTSEQIKDSIRNTAVRDSFTGPPDWTPQFGVGKLNIAAAIELGGRPVYTISGKINGLGAEATASVNLSGSKIELASVDSSGNYRFRNLVAGGTYTVTPRVQSIYQYSLTPPSYTFSNLGANQSADFSASRANYNISGRVTGPSGNGVAGISIRPNFGSSQTVLTDANGNYLLENLPAGISYDVVAGNLNYVLDPTHQFVGKLTKDEVVNFTASRLFSITGQVKDKTGKGLANAFVQALGPFSPQADTDSNGNYRLNSIVEAGTYTITARLNSYVVEPNGALVTNVSSDQTLDFVAHQATTTSAISGFVRDPNGNGVANVRVQLSGSLSGVGLTNLNGLYRFENNDSGGNYTVTPSAPGMSFTPASRSITNLSGNPGSQDFVTFTNPIDVAGLFVAQHYRDFLSREPDQSGLQFWTNEITSCGSQSACIEPKRINVSASFFLSIEFQQSGYLVERFYKVAYGNGSGNSTFGGTHQLQVPVVRFSEFLQGTQRIGKDLIVLQPGWEQLLENNKQAYALEFVQTTRFITAFATTMTPAEFVDRLNQNAGNVLSASERTAAINFFGAAGDTSNNTARAQALRQVAEDTDLYNAEYNRAFVLAEYFGYLRRNPNDAPESTLDYTGYDFWLTKLNQFNGNYINAEMVKAFLSSIEYRQRFGP
jgi:subtilisin family serine protease